MATELLQEFEGGGTTVVLKGRYAELPSITAIGMNALAPVSQSGRLILAGSDGFKGFKTGEYTVRKPDERVRAMGDRSVDNVSAGRKQAIELSLSEVCNRSTTSLKKSCDANLIVVHSKEIDDAGEANVGIATFETWLQQIKSAWNHLKSIGVNEFVFTADHGFLLQDQTTRVEKYQNATRRYFISQESRCEDKIATVSLKALKYDGQEGYLLFRKDTAVFATGNPNATFVHGGNSLQERVIPVLSVSHRHQSNLTIVSRSLQGEAPIAIESNSADWQDNFEDEAVRNVFLHLQQHGSITEPELNQMLGSVRRGRHFALDFEEHLKQVPFSVRIETTTNGKRYVKQYGN